MIARFCLYFVESVYPQVILYNRLYGKDASQELADIRFKQFGISFVIFGLVCSLVCFCVARYVVCGSIQSMWTVAVCLGVAASLAKVVSGKINKLGLYEATLEKIKRMDIAALKALYRRTLLVGCLRAILVPLTVTVAIVLLGRFL